MFPPVFRLLLSLLAALPVAAHAEQTVLRLQGSNTIGSVLAPALVRGMLQAQAVQDIQTLPGAVANEVQVKGRTAQGQLIQVSIAAHGSSTGFTALKTGDADLAAASRPIKDSELVDLEALGDLKSAEAEQVIALDGVAVIVHPDNPLPQLTTEQLANIFAGRITTWEALGLGSGPIRLYARDDRSGTFETFKSLVLDTHDLTLATSTTRFESSEQLAAEVRRDRQAIGFSSLSSVHGAKVLAIADGAASAMLPTPGLIASEDYPLARRLYFYLPPGQHNPWAQALIRFAQSEPGQSIVTASGFIAQTIQAMPVRANAEMPAAYRGLLEQAQRLSVNFRFAEGSATLDNKAQADLQRVVAYLKRTGKLDQKISLVGFGDAKSDPARATLLSKLRAMAVRRELARQGVTAREILGLGAELPVAANDQDESRLRNRRVEVWVY
uniref:phosphate ABC transporter substrate-binding/OmpA family protein n=1 Tax=Pseudomonas laurentiana TaxID=2364649 RepID=UPI0029C88F54|nr:phosphate ABC transporter substrate-binding/OmpA family protein [Pseudomonas laurentiana]